MSEETLNPFHLNKNKLSLPCLKLILDDSRVCGLGDDNSSALRVSTNWHSVCNTSLRCERVFNIASLWLATASIPAMDSIAFRCCTCDLMLLQNHLQ